MSSKESPSHIRGSRCRRRRWNKRARAVVAPSHGLPVARPAQAPLLLGPTVMATRAEQFRSDAQRTHGERGGKAKKKGKTRVSERRPKKAAWSHDKAHAGAKATHALEQVAPGQRASRTSTRKSSNRAKGDSAFTRTEESKKGAPTNLARKSRARGAKVRGSSPTRP